MALKIIVNTQHCPSHWHIQDWQPQTRQLPLQQMTSVMTIRDAIGHTQTATYTQNL
jgi:hypothetical protein